MKLLYQLTHEHIIEEAEKVSDTKLLGFFSSEEICNNAIATYCIQPGFKDYPENFIIEIVQANINDFNNLPGEFGSSVFLLMHEWYDGEYDYVSDLGCYSSFKYAKEAEVMYSLEQEFAEHKEGFSIDEYIIDEMEWKEGFFTWR